MSDPSQSPSSSPSALIAALLAALAGTVIIYAIGIATYTDNGIPNADDVMRMVSVRDLLAGQGWFDPVQYRLGLDGGTLMHWSRLVDAPILGFYALAFLITGSAETAEIFAKFAWPATTLFIALLGVNIACNRLARPQMRVPATIIATVCFLTLGIFNPGSLDHHNIQVALAIWMVALLLPSEHAQMSAYGAAGVITTLMLAIGMESLPYATLGGLWVAIAFLLGLADPKSVRAFGGFFALTALIVLALTVRPASYFQEYCDSFSFFHLGMCVTAGLGLVVSTQFSDSPQSRLMGLGATAVVTAGALVFVFPQCLSNPLAALDPKLIEFWLDGVVETRSLKDLWISDPYALFGILGMATAGLITSLYLVSKGADEVWSFAALSALLLIAAIGVTIWQQRGSMFAASFAILPLAYVVTQLRTQYQKTESVGALAKMVGVGIISLNMFWWVAGANAAKIFSDTPTLQEQAAAASPRDYCYTKDVYDVLATQPKGIVLGATDIGASILNFTHHRALAGPYHRNIDGNLAMIETMLALPNNAKTMLNVAGVTIIADCVNAIDARDFKRAAPLGLQSALHRGEIPSYLQLVPETKGQPLVLYRVLD